MKNGQLIVLISLFCVTAIFAFPKNDSTPIKKTIRLDEAIQNVPDYMLLANIETEDWLIEKLRLDDVTWKKFERDGEVIDLYVGYYFPIDKLSASHSPLVCMPGGGWVLEDLVEKAYSFNNYHLKYAEVTAGNNKNKSLITYWFQAYDKSAPNMYINIYNALVNVIKGKPPETAFIRITIPIRGGNRVKANKLTLDFIKEFYPIFMDYVDDRQP